MVDKDEACDGGMGWPIPSGTFSLVKEVLMSIRQVVIRLAGAAALPLRAPRTPKGPPWTGSSPTDGPF